MAPKIRPRGIRHPVHKQYVQVIDKFAVIFSRYIVIWLSIPHTTISSIKISKNFVLHLDSAIQYTMICITYTFMGIKIAMLIHLWVYFSTHQYTFMGWVLKVPAAQCTQKAVKLPPPPGGLLHFTLVI